MKKRIVSFVAAWMMIFSICNVNGMISYAEGAKLVVARNTNVPVMKPGEDVRFAIPIENIGTESATDVIISLDTSDLKSFPFVIDKMTTTKRISSIHGHSDEDIVFYLKVAMNAESKTYPIKVNGSYSTESGGGGSISETVYVKIENNLKKPSLKLTNVKYDGDSVFSGKQSTMKLELQNEGQSLAKDIELSFNGLKADGIRLDNYENTIKIKSIAARHFQDVPVKIHTDKNLNTGTYELELMMKYKDEYDQEYEKKTKIYVPVDGVGDQELDFAFENLTYPQNGVGNNEDFVIAFDLKNLSGQDAKNIKVSVDAGTEILPKSASVKNIKSLTSGQSNHVEFKLFAKDGIESKNYPIKINVDYGQKGEKADATQSISQYVGIFVKGDNSKLTPKIIIDNYDFGAEYIKTGETFPLAISFLNTNKNHAVRNIKVSLSSEGEVFSPVGSSNSFFINEIGANGHAQKTVKLKPKVDAEQKTYNLTVDIEYEDSQGKQFTSKEIISIPVIQEVKFVVGDVAIPDEIFVGSSTGISAQFYNLGRGTLRNLMIHTEGDFEVKDGNVFVGNFEAGKNDYYDATIIPSKKGKVTGKIIFEYEDVIGTKFTTEKDITLEAMEEEVPSMPDPSMEMEQEKPKNTKKWMIAGGVVLLLAGAFVIVRRKRKKKAEEVSLDE